MTKAYSIFLTVLFTVFIGGVLVISALLPKEEFSEMENRFLQKPPELSIETVKMGNSWRIQRSMSATTSQAGTSG